MQFSGKTVLVTGCTSGVGRETAKAFAESGATVIITGRDDQRVKNVVAEISPPASSARARGGCRFEHGRVAGGAS